MSRLYLEAVCGLVFGLLISLPGAIITESHAPILISGIVAGKWGNCI